MQSVFYREAMDLLGIKASIIRAGDFKGAVEPFMNPQMSDHLRRHYLEMLESINDARVSVIAKGVALQRPLYARFKETIPASSGSPVGRAGRSTRSLRRDARDDRETG